MCDNIEVYDTEGKLIEDIYSIREDKACLCCSKRPEITEWLLDKYGYVAIQRTPFGWEVRLTENSIRKE